MAFTQIGRSSASMTIRVIGSDAVLRALHELPQKLQDQLVSKELVASAERIKTDLLLNLTGRKVNERTGALVSAFEFQPAHRLKATINKGLVRYGIAYPTRAELGIPLKAKGYYPTALEYGTKERVQTTYRGKPLEKPRKLGSIVARRYVRDAIDEHRARETRLLTLGIQRRINQWWDRKFRHQARGLQL